MVVFNDNASPRQCGVEFQRQKTFADSHRNIKLKQLHGASSMENLTPIVQLRPFNQHDWRPEKSIVLDPAEKELFEDDLEIPVTSRDFSSVKSEQAPTLRKRKSDESPRSSNNQTVVTYTSASLPPIGPSVTRILPTIITPTSAPSSLQDTSPVRDPLRGLWTPRAPPRHSGRPEYKLADGFAPTPAERQKSTLRDIKMGYCEPLGSGAVKRMGRGSLKRPSKSRPNTPSSKDTRSISFRSPSPSSKKSSSRIQDYGHYRMILNRSVPGHLKALDMNMYFNATLPQMDTSALFDSAFGFFVNDSDQQASLPDIQVQNAALYDKVKGLKVLDRLSCAQSAESFPFSLTKVGLVEDALEKSFKKPLGIERQMTMQSKMVLEDERRNKGKQKTRPPINSGRFAHVGPPTLGELMIRQGRRSNSVRASPTKQRWEPRRRSLIGHQDSQDSGIMSPAGTESVDLPELPGPQPSSDTAPTVSILQNTASKAEQTPEGRQRTWMESESSIDHEPT